MSRATNALPICREKEESAIATWSDNRFHRYTKVILPASVFHSKLRMDKIVPSVCEKWLGGCMLRRGQSITTHKTFSEVVARPMAFP
jgi:hypothetical protein